MAKEVLSLARRKLRRLLQRYSQRELAKLTAVPQSSICCINSGARKETRQSTRRRFEKVGIDAGDWDR